MSSLDTTARAPARTMQVQARRTILAMGIAATCMLGAVTSAEAVDAPAPRAAVQLLVPGGATAVAARGNVVATISTLGSSVSFIDAAGLTVRSTTALPTAPAALALSPDGALAYVAAGSRIVVVDTTSGALVRTVDYSTESIDEFRGCGSMLLGSTAKSPEGMATSPNGHLIDFVVECSGFPGIFSVDTQTMAVAKKTWTYLNRGGLGPPIGPLAVFDDRTIVRTVSPNDYCMNDQEHGGCPSTPRVITTGDPTSATVWVNVLPAGPFSALTRDPMTGTLLASKGDSLVWVDPVSGEQARSLKGVGSAFVDLKVDPSTGLIYGQDEQGTVVVDPASGRVLGMIMTTLDAVAGGRGYHATATGIDVIDVGSGLVPTQPIAVTAKVGRAVKGKVSATVTWQAPASSASTPATAYWLRGYSYRNASDKKPAVVAIKVGPETMSSRITMKQVTTTNALMPERAERGRGQFLGVTAVPQVNIASHTFHLT
jgi:hypothetical protein